MNIFKVSASKAVFIMMAAASISLTIMGIMDVKDFGLLTGMAFSFYFSNKGNPSEEYLGK